MSKKKALPTTGPTVINSKLSYQGKRAFLMAMTKKEHEDLDKFTKTNNFSATQAIEFLALAALRPGVGEDLKPVELNTCKVQAIISSDLSSKLREKADALNLSMKDLILESLRRSK